MGASCSSSNEVVDKVPPQASSAPKKGKKKSFFSRLFGRKKSSVHGESVERDDAMEEDLSAWDVFRDDVVGGVYHVPTAAMRLISRGDLDDMDDE